MDIDPCYERSFRFLFSMRLTVIYKLLFFFFFICLESIVSHKLSSCRDNCVKGYVQRWYIPGEFMI